MPATPINQTEGPNASEIAGAPPYIWRSRGRFRQLLGGPQTPEAIRKRIATLDAKRRKGQKITLPTIGLLQEPPA